MLANDCSVTARRKSNRPSDSGGVRPRQERDLKGRCLKFAEREEITVRRIQGRSLRQIGAAIGRSPSTTYQSLYTQSRGTLKRGLTACLRTGRAVHRPSRKVGQRKNRIPDMINIAERPPEVQDRAVPGHWEGDLIIGKRNQTAIGTLVEHTTNCTLLIHLPDGYKSEQMRDILRQAAKYFAGEMNW